MTAALSTALALPVSSTSVPYLSPKATRAVGAASHALCSLIPDAGAARRRAQC
jgi:hypothetical protein